jgi:protein-S-isoprenylcysteine O-methyltransferase Ste14
MAAGTKLPENGDMVDPQEERGARVRLPPPLVYLLSIVVGFIVQYAGLPLRLGGPPAVRIAAGAVVTLAGILLGGSAFGLFRKSGQDPAPWKPTPSLVFDGPYRITRNPMYVGMTAVQVGVGLLADNLWVVALAAASLLTVHVSAVRPEEKYLTEKFGAQYEEYLRRVRRYL